MRSLWQHVFSILDAFRNELPLHYFIKAYYKKFPILGSRDRRGISDAVYAWYRCGKAFKEDKHSREEQVVAALFLCALQPKAFAKAFPESWQDRTDLPVEARLDFLQQQGYSIDLNQLFPFDIALSDGIDAYQLRLSVLQQPDLFLRIRKSRDKVEKLLSQQNIPFNWLGDDCLALPNSTTVEPLLPRDAYAIQDASSQATGSYFNATANEVWWDCCAGAGGKSLLLKDLEPTVQLWVSDVRESILSNLRERFKQYALTQPRAIVIDAADGKSIRNALGNQRFNAVLCDVPCTGSGTWARTPEGLYFFDADSLQTYSQRGTAILRNVVEQLKPGGKVIYMTCSVFREENEAVVEQIAAEKGLTITASKLINGIGHKADCLFVAVLEQV